MKSRREFLAVLGLGASALLLPSVGRACGRRRRHRPCAETQVRAGCTSDHACVQSYYGNVNGVYYYYCWCCYGDTNCTMCNANDTTYIAPNGDCTKGPSCGYIDFAGPGYRLGRPGYHPSGCCNQMGRQFIAPTNPPEFHTSGSCKLNGLSQPIPAASSWDLTDGNNAGNVANAQQKNIIPPLSFLDLHSNPRGVLLYDMNLSPNDQTILRVGQELDTSVGPLPPLGAKLVLSKPHPANYHYIIQLLPQYDPDPTRGPFHIITYKP